MDLMKSLEIQSSLSSKALKSKLQKIINLGDDFNYKNIEEILSNEEFMNTL